MKKPIDLNKIASRLGAQRRGKVVAGGGYFGALQLAAEVQARFKAPVGGGRATDPSWNLRRQVPMTDATLKQLEILARNIEREANISLAPMQLAALILEKTTLQLTEVEAQELVRHGRGRANS